MVILELLKFLQVSNIGFGIFHLSNKCFLSAQELNFKPHHNLASFPRIN